jgi:leucyl/phenylalanyl-tRNA--protein transferase
MPVYRLSSELVFPSPHLAVDEGLLAVGGDLSVPRLLLAYTKGIFPWYSRGEPILWWSPDPRLVLYPADLKISRRLKRTLRQSRFQVTLDQAFDEVIHGCASVLRDRDKGTWITEEMIAAYIALHKAGFAHSVESWRDGQLAGGLYGISLGGSFFGESMFHLVRDASNIALVTLVRFLTKWNFNLIDCQVTTDHLKRMGAREISRKLFLHQLDESLKKQTMRGKWPPMVNDKA